VPVGCYYITSIDKPDIHEQSVRDWINDSIANINYAAGCLFKIRNVNSKWSRAGGTNLDKMAESFACDLVAKGIDTVLLCKHMFDNGALAIEKAFILWQQGGKGFVKAFFNNADFKPTENKIISFDAAALIDYFFTHRIDTITTEPQSEIWISHSLGYSIQLYTPNSFYRDRLTDFIIRQDKVHPKSVWWNMIAEKLGVLKKTTITQ
jgi:hypothetical protein